ncbi:MAG: hypothetical protein JSR65_01000 [Proteobacteria bacterium]|nr:hypothetical protein [Pseudomonadota bacterium]
MNDKHPLNWVDQATNLLDESARDLDAATLSRLNRARQTALEQHRRPRTAGIWLLPAGLVSACMLLLAVSFWQPHSRHDSPASAATTTAVATLSDTEVASEDATPEFYQDLDFYAWLDAQKGGDG